MKDLIAWSKVGFIVVIFYFLYVEAAPYECEGKAEFRVFENGARIGFEEGEVALFQQVLAGNALSDLLKQAGTPKLGVALESKALKKTIHLRPSIPSKDSREVGAIISLRHQDKSYVHKVLEAVVDRLETQSDSRYELDVLQPPSVYCSKN